MRLKLASLLLISATACLATISTTASAGILFEPRVGYNFDSLTTHTAAGDVKFNSTGPTLGLKLGYSFTVLSVSLMYDYGMLNTSVGEQPSGATYQGGTENRSSLYAVVGLKLPFVQIYGGYGIIDDWDFKSPSMGGTDVTFHGPGAIKIGAGFTGLPVIAINLEYTSTIFNKYTDTSDHDLNSASNFQSASGTSYMLVVSAPF